MIKPSWPAPVKVRAVITQTQFLPQQPGFSREPFGAFNLATHVGEAPQVVAANRRLLTEYFSLAPVQWLEQVHGTDVYNAISCALPPRADAVYTRKLGLPLAVLTADCLPVLFCTRAADEVAVAHAGWRGLANGVLVQTLKAFSADPSQIIAYLGPAIGPQYFEVGAEVRAVFAEGSHGSAESIDNCFTPSGRAGHFYGDLYTLARMQLQALGVSGVYGGDYNTYTDMRFYSFRRASHNGNGVCGRMASVIWLDGPAG